MKNNWPVKKLGDVAEIIGGYAFKSADLKETKISSDFLPVIKIGNLNNGGNLILDNLQYYKFNDNFLKFLIKVNDILVAMTGATTGKVSISNRDGLLLNQRVGLIRVRKELGYQDYLKYNLFSNKFYEYCQRTAGGGAQGNISPAQIMSFNISFPNLSVQKKIVERLDAIKKAQELIDLQIQKTEELFNSLIFSEIEKSNVNSFTLDEICKPQYGYTQSAKDSGKYRFIRITDIDDNGELKNNDIKYVSDEYSIIKPYILNIGDLLIARTGATYGKVLYFDQKEPAVFASFLIRLNPDISKILPKFLWLFSRSNLYWEQAKRLVSGTGQPQFNANKIKELKIKLPNIKKQHEIVEKLNAMQEYKKLLLGSKRLYKELFDSVLYKSMKGEID